MRRVCACSCCPCVHACCSRFRAEDPAEIGETELQSPAIKKEKDSKDAKSDGKADGAVAAAAAVGDEKVAAGYEKVPQWVVVNFQLPNYEPSNPLWGSQKEVGWC